MEMVLVPHQLELLGKLVAAHNKKPKQSFAVKYQDRSNPLRWIHHTALSAEIETFIGDIEDLGKDGIIKIKLDDWGPRFFKITPLGIKYYEYWWK